MHTQTGKALSSSSDKSAVFTFIPEVESQSKLPHNSCFIQTVSKMNEVLH